MSRIRRVAAPLLVDLLLGDDAFASEAATRVSNEDLWLPVIGLACGWRVVPMLRARLLSLEIPLPGAVADRLRALATKAAVKSTLLSHRAAEVLQAMTAAGIAVVPFKGIALIASVYENPAKRSLDDIDLLIPEHRVEASCRLLESLGFRMSIDVSLQEWLRHLDFRARLGNAYVVLRDENGVMIDLHWRLGMPGKARIDCEELLQSAASATLAGVEIQVPCMRDNILLIAHHLLRNHFAPHTAVKDLVDLRQILLHAKAAGQAREIGRSAQAKGLIVPLVAASMLLKERNRDGVVDAFSRCW